MTARLEIDGVKSVEVVRLLPDDVLVVECDRPLSESGRAYIRERLQEVWPNHRAVVLEMSLSLKVVRPEEVQP